jgi:hypothetical protein
MINPTRSEEETIKNWELRIENWELRMKREN